MLLASERFKAEQEALLAIDAHRVSDKLWIGSYPKDPRTCDIFDVIVLCASEKQTLPYACDNVIRVPLEDDKPTASEVALALRAANAVNKLRRSGKRVLVTCAQGVNRSSWVAAMAMIKTGTRPWKAIFDIREHRKPPIGMTPLCNPHFTEILMRF